MIRFEIRKRDGLARTGRLNLDGRTIPLPSAQEMEEIFPGLASRPLSHVPLLADADFVARYHQSGPGEPLILHPHSRADVPGGAVVMVSNWHTALSNPRQYVAWLVQLKEQVPSDTVWYAPAAAVPGNVHMLLYTGFDLFDFRAVDLCTARGLFCTGEGELPAETGDQLCSCSGCRSGDLFEHNRAALESAIRTASHFVERSRLRDLMEARSRLDPSQVAILRHLDARQAFIGRYVPIARPAPLLATTSDSLRRTEVQRFAERVVQRYRKPAGHTVAVLLPCSARKPYSTSQSHRKFIAAVAGRAHELIVTSPLALVPRELERVYPAAHYDVPVTGYWDREELHFTASVLAEYFRSHSYRRVIAHLGGGALRAAEMAASACAIELERTVSGSPTDEASIAALRHALEGEPKGKEDRIDGVLSWQFGTAADTAGLSIRGRYSEQIVVRGRTQLFSIDPETGLFKPTFEGWSMLDEGYRVTIGDFVPQGDILVPGILSVDPEILEGDEVLVQNDALLGTGRALMSAYEMRHSTRGAAVKVRKIKRL